MSRTFLDQIRSIFPGLGSRFIFPRVMVGRSACRPRELSLRNPDVFALCSACQQSVKNSQWRSKLNGSKPRGLNRQTVAEALIIWLFFFRHSHKNCSSRGFHNVEASNRNSLGRVTFSHWRASVFLTRPGDISVIL